MSNLFDHHLPQLKVYVLGGYIRTKTILCSKVLDFCSFFHFEDSEIMCIKPPALERVQNVHLVLGLLFLAVPILGVDGPQDIRQVMAHMMHFISCRNRF